MLQLSYRCYISFYILLFIRGTLAEKTKIVSRSTDIIPKSDPKSCDNDDSESFTSVPNMQEIERLDEENSYTPQKPSEVNEKCEREPIENEKQPKFDLRSQKSIILFTFLGTMVFLLIVCCNYCNQWRRRQSYDEIDANSEDEGSEVSTDSLFGSSRVVQLRFVGRLALIRNSPNATHRTAVNQRFGPTRSGSKDSDSSRQKDSDDSAVKPEQNPESCNPET